MTREQEQARRVSRNLKALKQACAISDPGTIDAMAKRLLRLAKAAHHTKGQTS